MPPKYLSSILFLLYLIFLASIICAFRAISSMVVGAILLVGLIKNYQETGRFFNKRMHNLFLYGCLGFYLIQLAGLAYSTNIKECLTGLQQKSGLIFVPLALCCCNYIQPATWKRLMNFFIAFVAAASLYCLVFAFIKSTYEGADASVFFYHELVNPFKHHAIQFSILVFIAIARLLQMTRQNNYLYGRFNHAALVIFCLLFIFLLSSKLVIAITILFLLYHFITVMRTKKANRTVIIASLICCLVATAAVFLTRNPISKRYREIMTENISIVRQDKFTPGNYFNGVQFRLLQWRFVKEILHENRAWLAGVGPGDSQDLLNSKYISTNMYIGGNPADKSHGFLGYNTHDQWLESMLQSGILGLVMFLVISYAMVKMAWERKKASFSALVILLLLYTFNESVLETQYGMMIFLFFPLFYYHGLENDITASPSA